MKKKLVLLSGGLDSASILVDLIFNGVPKEDILCIGFDYGQPHKNELDKASFLCEDMGISFEVHNLPNLEKNGDIFEYRNLLFLTESHKIASRYNIEEIYIGCCGNDQAGFPDCTPEFIESVQNTLDIGYGKGITIKTPLIDSNKVSTLKKLNETGWLEFILNNTMTCYKGTNCGVCTSCLERDKSLKEFYNDKD